jgi:DNA-binding winged helix-turn-helix (wHTH) protein
MTHMNKNANCHDNGYTLGEWQVFPETGLLTKGDHHTRAEPKVMQVLEYLILAKGKMVTRDELIDRAWPGIVVGTTQELQTIAAQTGDILCLCGCSIAGTVPVAELNQYEQ